jgi:hypothetical protein
MEYATFRFTGTFQTLQTFQTSLNFLSSGNETQKRYIYQQENAPKYFVRYEVCFVHFDALIRDMEIAGPKSHT